MVYMYGSQYLLWVGLRYMSTLPKTTSTVPTSMTRSARHVPKDSLGATCR